MAFEIAFPKNREYWRIDFQVKHKKDHEQHPENIYTYDSVHISNFVFSFLSLLWFHFRFFHILPFLETVISIWYVFLLCYLSFSFFKMSTSNRKVNLEFNSMKKKLLFLCLEIILSMLFASLWFECLIQVKTCTYPSSIYSIKSKAKFHLLFFSS